MRTTSTVSGALVGLASASIVVALMFGLRLAFGLQALPDVAADALTLILPGAVFGFLIDRLQEFGRPLMLVGLSTGLLALGALAGGARARLLKTWPPAARVGATTLAVSLLTLPAVFLALPPDMAAEPVLTTLAYWLVFALLVEWGLSTAAGRRILAGPGLTRRALLYGAGALGATYLGSYLGARLAHAVRLGGRRPVANATPPPTPPPPSPGASAAPPPDPFAGITGLTQTKDFYVVTKNGVNDPAIDAGRWRLQVSGERPYTISYDELRALPSSERPYTLECVSNLVGGSLISTAPLRGVPLHDLLVRAGVPPGTREIRFASADGYTESIPLEHANDPLTLVAYAINGEPLPKEHGFPARIVLSGRYGFKQPKWLTSIAPTAQPYSGYWVQRGWNKDGFILTMSRIDWPAEQILVPVGKPFDLMHGLAFAGDRGIAKVEVSFDDGGSWDAARLRPVLPTDNWLPWTYVWTPAAPGTYQIVVRATDGEGRLQDSTERDSFPNGATGYHRRTVKAG